MVKLHVLKELWRKWGHSSFHSSNGVLKMTQYVSRTEESAITSGVEQISLLPHPCDWRGRLYCHMRLWHGGQGAKH